MASTRTTTRTIRIENETAEYFKEKALNRAVESLHGLLTSGAIEFDGEKLTIPSAGKTSGCVHQNEEKSSNLCTPKEDSSLDSIKEMANLMMVPTESLIDAIKEALENGTLYYSNGKLINPRYEEFERACVGKNIDKILESVIRSL